MQVHLQTISSSLVRIGRTHFKIEGWHCLLHIFISSLSICCYSINIYAVGITSQNRQLVVGYTSGDIGAIVMVAVGVWRVI